MASGQDNDNIRQRVKNLSAIISAEIDPRGHILNTMFQNGVITIKENFDINAGSNKEDRAEKLLMILFKSHHPRVLNVFRDSLEEDYDWIIEKIDKISVTTGSSTGITCENKSSTAFAHQQNMASVSMSDTTTSSQSNVAPHPATSMSSLSSQLGEITISNTASSLTRSDSLPSVLSLGEVVSCPEQLQTTKFGQNSRKFKVFQI
jgi:hypothetical protein